MNKKWETFESSYLKIFETFEFNNESRVSFSKFSINRLVKLFSSFNEFDGEMTKV